MTPEQLWATVSLWSLRRSLAALSRAAVAASGAQSGDLGTVQGWRPGSGVLSGSHGDVVGEAVARGGTDVADEYQGQHRAARETVMWVAGNVRVTASSDVDDTLAGLIAAAGTWPGTLAWRVHQWMDHEDQRVRRVLREPADRHPIPQLRCPACGLSGMLALLTAPPQGQRPVACASAICVCAGPGCACGVSQPAQGLPHVWTQPQLTELFQARDAAARGAA